MKLHIQLEPYNGTRFDFLELEVQTAEEIIKVYEDLKKAFPNPPVKLSNHENKIFKNDGYAYFKNGNPILTTDKKQIKKIIFDELVKKGKKP